MVAAAIAVAEEGVAAGGLPVGAVVVMGDDVIARQLAHADLLAMSAADQRLGWSRRSAPLRLAVSLEPCLTCLGAAMTLGVTAVYSDSSRRTMVLLTTVAAAPRPIPLWDQLPMFALWLLPAAVGVPILIRALRRRRVPPAVSSSC